MSNDKQWSGSTTLKGLVHVQSGEGPVKLAKQAEQTPARLQS
jgi:hypothetical protein